MKKYIIVAHTEIQAKLFRKDNHLMKSEAIYASNPKVIEGISNCVVIFLDGWRSHPHARQIADMVNLVKARYGIDVLHMKDTDLLEKKVKQPLHSPDCEMTNPQFVAWLRRLADTIEGGDDDGIAYELSEWLICVYDTDTATHVACSTPENHWKV